MTAPGFARAVVESAWRRAARARYRTEMALADDWEPVAVDPAVDALSDASRILYLCLGNVCRSPFAQRLTERKLAKRGVADVRIDSAGLSTTDGRSSPETAVAVAREYGINLGPHRAMEVRQTDIEQADVVFLMDLNNYWRLRRLGAARDADCYFLGVLDDPSDPEIDDPYGDPPDTFRDVYGRIETGVQRVVEALEPSVTESSGSEHVHEWD